VSEPSKQADLAGRCAQIANEIQQLSPNVHVSLHEVITALAKSNPGVAYLVCKKYVSEKGLKVADLGFVGVTEGFAPGDEGGYLFAPYDILLFLSPRKLKTGDLVLRHLVDPKKGSASELTYLRVVSFSAQGGVEVETLLGEKKRFTVSELTILGKLGRVIPFDTPEWHELIGQIYTKEECISGLNRDVEYFSALSLPDKEKVLTELRRRVAVLTNEGK
jgi:hypothetical protein